MKFIAAYKSDTNGNLTGNEILVWPDSAITASGKPVFLPEEDGYKFQVGLGAKISAVGKTIKRKFAGRYYSEIFPVAVFLTPRAAKAISEGEDPKGCDLVSDYSVVCGNPMARPGGECSLEMDLELSPLAYGTDEGETLSNEIRVSGWEECIGRAIGTASIRNTLKTGDTVAILLPQTYPAKPDCLLTVSMAGHKLIENKLK